VKYGLAVQSGTAALHTAMKALGVSRSKHHVVLPGYTCSAVADAVVQAGGSPVVADVEAETWGLDAAKLETILRTEPLVVGVVLIHTYGVPMRDTFKCLELCEQYGVWVLEDCSECHGARVFNPSTNEHVRCGSLGKVAAFSARSEKMVGVGEGGGVVSSDAELMAAARWWASRAPCRRVPMWQMYAHEEVGMNYRLPEMLSAVGVASINNLDRMVFKKREVHTWYIEELAALGGTYGRLQQQAHESDEPVWWITAFMLPEGVDPEKVGALLKLKAVEVRPGFYPIGVTLPFFKHSRGQDACADVYTRLLCLPSSCHLERQDVAEIMGYFKDAVDACRDKGAYTIDMAHPPA